MFPAARLLEALYFTNSTCCFFRFTLILSSRVRIAWLLGSSKICVLSSSPSFARLVHRVHSCTTRKLLPVENRCCPWEGKNTQYEKQELRASRVIRRIPRFCCGNKKYVVFHHWFSAPRFFFRWSLCAIVVYRVTLNERKLLDRQFGISSSFLLCTHILGFTKKKDLKKERIYLREQY